jgi:DNA-binding winged helix-turn-helix (wHTH) protein/Tol biopolymer transport system component
LHGERDPTHHSGVARSPARLQFGPITLVPDERVLLKDGQPVALTPKAFDLLVFLAANPGRLLTKDEILRAVWPDAVVEESNLAYHVFAIRKAIGDGSDTDRYIETVPKRGYRFIPPVVQLSENDASAAELGQRVALSGVEAAEGPVVAGSVATGDGAATVRRQSLRVAPWFAWVVGLTGLVIGAGAVGFFSLERRSVVAPPSLVRFQEPLWGLPAEPTMFSISPDSRHLVQAIQGVDGVARLWVRTLSESARRPLPESEGVIIPPAVWSPRSDAIAFANGGPLKRVTLSGGVPQTVCEVPGLAVGGSWNRDDVILVGNPDGPLLRCPASGGSATPVTRTTDPAEIHLMPSFLSDGRHFIYLRIHRSAPERSGVYVGEVNGSGPADEKRLLATGFNAIHVPESDSGASAMVFLREGALFAQRFDEQRLELRGAPVQVADSVGSYLDYAFFSASPRVLVYREPDPFYQLTWFDRDGREVRRVGAPEPVAGLALSPSGDRALVAKHVPRNVVDQDIWMLNLDREANPVKLTFAATLEAWPTWLTNDRFAYSASGGETTIYEQTIGSSERRVWFQAIGAGNLTVVGDGRVVVFVGSNGPAMRTDLWVRTEHGPPDGAPLITHEGDQVQPQLSPDGQRLAYVSNETGRNEVFVASFRYDSSTGKVSVGDIVPVSDGGGFAPRWRGDGKELFYLKLDGSVMAVAVSTTALGAPKAARRLFTASGVFPEWGVTYDGSRLLFAVPTAPPPPLQIIQNWQAVLPN